MSDTADFRSLIAMIKIAGKIGILGTGTHGDFSLESKIHCDEHIKSSMCPWLKETTQHNAC